MHFTRHVLLWAPICRILQYSMRAHLQTYITYSTWIQTCIQRYSTCISTVHTVSTVITSIRYRLHCTTVQYIQYIRYVYTSRDYITYLWYIYSNLVLLVNTFSRQKMKRMYIEANITLDCVTLHYMALHYITVQYISLYYSTVQYIIVLFVT